MVDEIIATLLHHVVHVCVCVCVCMMQDGVTPLMYAAKVGHLEIAKELLHKFADVKIQEEVTITDILYITI